MSMGVPFFSVIVTAFNSAGFIRKGLDSIRDQDFKDYELIVICDKCVDNTADVAREYADVVREMDHDRDGQSVNMGLDLARGVWLLFMDDDDWYLPGAFRKIAEELQRRPYIDILAYGFEWKHIGTTYNSPRKVYPAVWNKAWRREFVGDTRYPDWRVSSDLGFARQLHPRARFAYMYEPLYYYNFMRKGSCSEKLRNGEYDKTDMPEPARAAAEGYKKWLQSKEFEE